LDRVVTRYTVVAGMRRHCVLVLLLAAALVALPRAAGAAGLDVPLTVEEATGVARHAEPVTFGVPLPRGLITDVARLRLYSQDARPVLAAFRVVNRWWGDGSVQWVHADFLADVSARGKSVYHLRLSGEPAREPKPALRVEPHGDDVRVDTGAIQFTVHRTGP